ncbi:hypothetical protein J6590_062837 [Homalodisca vitripennis]|nr:hypothetical protein J6590_062837 [Homalodisca vitripennis]
MCDERDEAAEHLLFDCPTIASERYAIFGDLKASYLEVQPSQIGGSTQLQQERHRGQLRTRQTPPPTEENNFPTEVLSPEEAVDCLPEYL